VTDLLHCLLQHMGQLQSALALTFQQMERHALRALAAYTWQAAQRFDQFGEERG